MDRVLLLLTSLYEATKRALHSLRQSAPDLRQLYFQNPKFGFYFLRLTSERLFRDIRRLEAAQGQAAV